MSEHWIILGIAVAGFFYVSGIVLAVDAVMTVRTSQGSIAWTVSLLTFPYVAVPLYWVFGRSKYYGYIDARRTENKDMQPIIDRVVPAMPEFVVHLEDDHMNFTVMEKLAAMPFTRYNDAELLVDGQQTFAAIFAGIESAREYLLVQYFIIKDDDRCAREGHVRAGFRQLAHGGAGGTGCETHLVQVRRARRAPPGSESVAVSDRRARISPDSGSRVPWVWHWH